MAPQPGPSFRIRGTHSASAQPRCEWIQASPLPKTSSVVHAELGPSLASNKPEVWSRGGQAGLIFSNAKATLPPLSPLDSFSQDWLLPGIWNGSHLLPFQITPPRWSREENYVSWQSWGRTHREQGPGKATGVRIF